MKKVLISVMALITVILMSTNVMAATTGSVTLAASTGIVKAKDEFTVTVKASDSNNLNTVEYSSITVTDASGKATNAISFKSVEVIGEWSNMNYDGKTAFVYSGSATKEQNVCKLTFVVSEDISAGTYNINVNGLTVYSTNLSDDTTTIGTKTVSVVVEEQKADDDDNTGGNTGDNKPSEDGNQGGVGDNKPSEDENKNDNTTTGGNNQDNSATGNNNQGNTATGGNTTTGGEKLPQTGIENVTVIAILIVSIISVVSFISYRKYSDIK